MMISKIADRHLSRQACIYIRQSTMGQVRFNQESTERQYNLVSKAQALGWSPQQIRILDREALSRHACMNVAAKPLDAAVASRLVTAVTPLTIKLALEALTSLEERDKAIAAQWRRRIERARYDADLAERRYEAVDPGNRLIAATLEQRWNDA